jgi:pyridoxal phosphate enzyme (YggS family)
MSIAENIARVQERIAAASRRAGRDPSQITLVAVSKTFPPDCIREAYDAGLRVFGENRVQEFDAKSESLRELEGTQWRLIGHLQTNKSQKAAELFQAIDSVDSLRLAEKLNQAASRLRKRLEVLIEVNVGGEAAKSGIAIGSGELARILYAAPDLAHLNFCGLMTVPPYTEDPDRARPYFRRLRELRDAVLAPAMPGLNLGTLSMGMSHDFEVAIEEGATCVRVGTAIFGERAGPHATAPHENPESSVIA